MPKVLRIINRFNLGGPTFNAAYLTKYLSPEYETLLIGGQKDETEEQSEFIVRDLGIEPIIIPEMQRAINPKMDRIAYKKIKKIIQEFKPDIVHTHASKAGFIGRYAAYKCNVPVIVHTFHGHVFHSYFNKYKTSLYKNIERYLAKKSSKIIAISEKQKHELSGIHKIAKPENIEIVPLGFDLTRFNENQEAKRKQFREEYNIADDEIAIGIVGRLVPIKNHGLFLEGLKNVSKKTNKKIRAFIVGDGESRALIEEKAKELNIDFVDGTKSKENKLLTFTSWIKDVDVVYAGLDIVTLTSLNEGTPVSLIEAQAACKPIISTKVGGVENIVKESDTAFLVENNSVNEFSDKLLQLVEDDELREMMSKNGWNLVKEKFHYTRLIEDVKALYKDLLCAHNR